MNHYTPLLSPLSLPFSPQKSLFGSDIKSILNRNWFGGCNVIDCDNKSSRNCVTSRNWFRSWRRYSSISRGRTRIVGTSLRSIFILIWRIEWYVDGQRELLFLLRNAATYHLLLDTTYVDCGFIITDVIIFRYVSTIDDTRFTISDTSLFIAYQKYRNLSSRGRWCWFFAICRWDKGLLDYYLDQEFWTLLDWSSLLLSKLSHDLRYHIV